VGSASPAVAQLRRTWVPAKAAKMIDCVGRAAMKRVFLLRQLA